MIHNRRCRCGFAVVMAMIALTIVGAAVVALSALITTEARRTRAAANEAELRQMLVMGAAVVSEQARHWQSAPSSDELPVTLPKLLADDGAKLTIQMIASNGGRTVEARINALFGSKRMTQRVTFAKSGSAYAMTAAALE